MKHQIKRIVIVTFAVAIIACIGLLSARARANDDNAADTYKTSKCVVCHGAKAEKKFDATISEEEMIKVVLNGKKAEKPPNMPAYGEKGISADQAKALIAYMKSLQ